MPWPMRWSSSNPKKLGGRKVGRVWKIGVDRIPRFYNSNRSRLVCMIHLGQAGFLTFSFLSGSMNWLACLTGSRSMKQVQLFRFFVFVKQMRHPYVAAEVIWWLKSADAGKSPVAMTRWTLALHSSTPSLYTTIPTVESFFNSSTIGFKNVSKRRLGLLGPGNTASWKVYGSRYLFKWK